MTQLTNVGQGPAEAHLTERDLAARWVCSVKLLQKLRLTGGGCPYLKLTSGLVRYRLIDVIAWEENAVRLSTSDQGVGG